MGKLSRGKLLDLAHDLYFRLKDESKVIQDLPMRQYHRFAKYTIKESWYEDLASPEDVMVEIAVVEGPHPWLHYHKESHAVNIILGEPHGVTQPPPMAEIVAGRDVMPANTGYQVFFPENLPHTFNAPEGEQFYFLSIQSPPLERTVDGVEIDDFHWIESD